LQRLLLLLLLLPVLSGLKRHSVTLFEGGRVGGAAVMDELITELAASAAAGEFFEGDMVQVSATQQYTYTFFIWNNVTPVGRVWNGSVDHSRSSGNIFLVAVLSPRCAVSSTTFKFLLPLCYAL
jgi:hypothetical protein